MKKIISLLWQCLLPFLFSNLILVVNIQAQVFVKLVQPPPNQLRATDIWNVTLINSGKSTLQVTLFGTLQEAGEGIMVEGNSKLISLLPGAKKITSDDVKTGNINFKSGKWREAFTRTGNAPSGDYTICMHVKNQSGEEIGSDCIEQKVEISGAPQLLNPVNGDSINSETLPIFTWLAPVPLPSNPIKYKIKIVEILGNQSVQAAIQSNNAWFEKNDITITMFTYPVSAGKIIKNKKYAWTIQCIDNQGQGIGENNGIASPFIMNTKNVNIPGDTSSTSGNGVAAVGDTIKAGLNGEFKVIVTKISTESDSSLTGQGKVHIKWLKTYVAVEFKKIRIDTTKQLKAGGIVTYIDSSMGTSFWDYPKAWGLSWLSGNIANKADGIMNWTNNTVNNLVEWVNNVAPGSKPLINYNDTIATPTIPDYSLKMPFGLQFNNGNEQLVITEIIFKPDESKINFLAEKKFTKSGSVYKLGFAGKYFKIHPNSINFSEGRVELAEDINIPNTAVNPKMKFIFKKGGLNSGCFIQWADSGITNISLGLDIKFSREWLLPAAPTATGTTSIMTPTQSVMTPTQSVMTPTQSVMTPTQSVMTPTQSVMTPTQSVMTPTQSVMTPTQSVMTPTQISGNTATNTVSTDTVKATISGNGTSLKDILLTGTLPNCEIVGTNGIKIEADSISLDLSDIRNPGGMVFPKNYTHDTTEQGKLHWQGIYVKSLVLTLPDTWKTGNNAPRIATNDLIIDDFGVTCKVLATNVFTFPNGRVADLSASLDTINVSILKGSLTSGSATGLVVLPICRDTITNTLKYSATFNLAAGGNNFQLAIIPLGPIKADILKAMMTLDSTSIIKVTKTTSQLNVLMNLNGSFKWDNPDLSIPEVSSTFRSLGIKGIVIEMDFENVGLTYVNNPGQNNDSISFKIGTWSFASPQKLLANFPVSIKKIYYKSLSKVTPTNPNMKELVRGALMIDIIANLTEDIGGTTTVGAAFAVELNKSAKKFVPEFKGVFVDSIKVHADIPAVKINGSLDMYDHDSKFGDGYKATMGVTFTAVSLQINALVQFGNTTWANNNQFYRYWRVEADAKFSPGIPFLPGIGFYGFGGGAYYNMKTDSIMSTANPGNYTYTFVPKKSTFGLIAKAIIGTFPKVETFNADASLMAEFNNNTNGLVLIAFEGKFWLATKLLDRLNAKIYGDVNVNYKFTDKIFYMGADLTINVPGVITTPTPVGFVLNIDGRNNLWYFKFGTPAGPNTVDVLGLNLYSYLMFGNYIPYPNGFTPKFITGYYSAIGSYPTLGGNVGSGGVGDSTKTGKGIATGVGIKFDKTYNDDIYKGLCRQWSIEAALNVGAELNLAFMDQIGCAGINGYRASGNVGLYFNLTTTIKGKCFSCTGWPLYCTDKSSDLFKIILGAWLGGEFPNPVYLYGGVDGKIGIFDDLIDVHFHKDFTYGSSCSGTVIDTTRNAAQEDKAGDLKNKLIQYIAPTIQYYFPLESTINVKYSLVPDQVFDVAENEGDGTIKDRTFKLALTTSLEVKNTDGTWVAKTLNSKVNNIGEYQYYLIGNNLQGVGTTSGIAGQTGVPTNPANTNSINSNSTSTMVTNNGNIISSLAPSPVPPPLVPNYPNQIPNPINNLVADMDYRFIVTATLKEKTGTTWNNAVTRTGAALIETKTFSFRTGKPTVTTGVTQN
jgi:hypothetical protein